jgi:hypothetical protein
MISSTSPRAATPQINSTAKVKDSDMARSLVSCLLSSFAVGVVQVRGSQGRIPGRMPTEENAARCVPGQREP